MAWLKKVLIDVLVTVVIAVFAFTGAAWGYWIVAIYTPLMLLLKLGAVMSRVTVKVKKDPNAAPAWFFHLLYAANVILLLVANFWIAAVGWAGIWILSAIQESRSSTKK